MFGRSKQEKSSTRRARSAEPACAGRHRGRRGRPSSATWAGTGATMVKGSSGVFGK